MATFKTDDFRTEILDDVLININPNATDLLKSLVNSEENDTENTNTLNKATIYLDNFDFYISLDVLKRNEILCDRFIKSDDNSLKIWTLLHFRKYPYNDLREAIYGECDQIFNLYLVIQEYCTVLFEIGLPPEIVHKVMLLLVYDKYHVLSENYCEYDTCNVCKKFITTSNSNFYSVLIEEYLRENDPNHFGDLPSQPMYSNVVCSKCYKDKELYKLPEVSDDDLEHDDFMLNDYFEHANLMLNQGSYSITHPDKHLDEITSVHIQEFHTKKNLTFYQCYYPIIMGAVDYCSGFLSIS